MSNRHFIAYCEKQIRDIEEYAAEVEPDRPIDASRLRYLVPGWERLIQKYEKQDRSHKQV